MLRIEDLRINQIVYHRYSQYKIIGLSQYFVRLIDSDHMYPSTFEVKIDEITLEKPKVKKEGWFILYKENAYGGYKTRFLDEWYTTEDEALKAIKLFGSYLKIQKIEWEE